MWHNDALRAGDEMFVKRNTNNTQTKVIATSTKCLIVANKIFPRQIYVK